VGVFDASASPPKEWYAVTETNVFQLTQPGAFADPLTEVLREPHVQSRSGTRP